MKRWVKKIISKSKTSSPLAKENTVALCGIFKNEHEYIVEWIAHHQSIGFSNFIIADNHSDDGSSQLLKTLDDLGIITRVDFPTQEGISPQLPAYSKIVEEYGEQYAWMGFIDADEFIVPSKDYDIIGALNELKDDSNVTSVRLNWKVFGSNGLKQQEPGLVIERFTKRASQSHPVNHHVKSFVKPAYFDKFINPHQPSTSQGIAVTPLNSKYSQESIGKSKQVEWSGASIHHYVIKSEQEFRKKKQPRGGGNNTNRRNFGYFTYHDLNDETDCTALSTLNQTQENIDTIRKALSWKEQESDCHKLFVHIPKTAGTSFRNGLEASVGREYICKDYGRDSQNTDASVDECFYQKNDLYSLSTKINNNWLVGHFPLKKYASISCASQCYSFVRAPLERLVSHYNHAVRYHDLSQSLNDFVPTVNEIQHNMLAGVPLKLMGFVGLTDKYSQSLRILNCIHGVNTPELKSNVNNKQVVKTDSLSDVDGLELSECLKKERNLYNLANSILIHRLKYLSCGLPYVHASARYLKERRELAGAAYFLNSQEVISIDVYIDGKFVTLLNASKIYRQPSCIQFPRDGHIGFGWKVPLRFKEGSSIKLLTTKTGQCLFEGKL